MVKREQFVIALNRAFADLDSDFILSNATDDVKWEIVGEKTVSGKKEFKKALNSMQGGAPFEIIVGKVIDSQDKSIVEGVVEVKVEPGKIKRYAFCDIYLFEDAKSNTFSNLRTYISQLKNKTNVEY